MISEVNTKLNDKKKELEQVIKELRKRITEKESVPSSSTNKTPSKEEENNRKLRPLLKAWRNQLKEAEKQHQERPLIIEWEYVSSKTGKGIRELNEKILNVFQEKTAIFEL